MNFVAHGWKCALAALTLLSAAAALSPGPGGAAIDIFEYIRQTWKVLTRSHASLAVAAVDPKFKAPPDGRWPVYVATSIDLDRVAGQLRAQMPPGEFAKIALRTLPSAPEPPIEPGLLYLPHPYVVPGGRFNEMYGWDSFFIQMGLLRDNDVVLAGDMVDNALYEVREYGKILNANRTYYLTRSQPPFLTGMVLAQYRRTRDRQWLAATLPEIEKYYRYWTSEPHLVPTTGLSRYLDTGKGPAPEVVSSELDKQGRTDYDLVKAWYRTHHFADYDVTKYYDAGRDELTPAFYQGDRSMRESGFDPSNRFGPFSADIVDYNPVCLNSLLYLMETQTAEILKELGRDTDAGVWRERAGQRAAAINRYLWDEKRGLYFDYDFARGQLRPYPFLTTFYPLWVGIASKEQAARVMSNLALFERPGGLQTSTYHSGDQWDAPYGWAPLQWIAMQGMRRYGFIPDAERVSLRFLTMVRQQYLRHGILVEKYDVVHPGANVGRGLRFGYHSNEAGFGWTNAVFTALFDDLSQPGKRELEKLRLAREAVFSGFCYCSNIMPPATPSASSVPRTNSELSEFLLRAAHDLRGPLRAARTHAELLRRDAAFPEASDVRGPLDFIVDGVLRAGLLVDGLTEYSLALQIDPATFQPAPLGVLLRATLAKLATSLRDRRAVVTYDSLPTVSGDGDRLMQLFELLLDNAVRNAGQDDPRIHVAAERRAEDWLFQVRDNGPGIAAEFLERVFQPFERIHGKERPGPGLATCRLIVENHGGAIWAESTAGTTFWFTLPAADRPHPIG